MDLKPVLLALCASAFGIAAETGSMVIRADHTSLRAGCAGDSTVRATLPSATPVLIRFQLSGETEPCYKIAATVEGKTVEGYVNGGALGGLEQFDRARREAESLDWSQMVRAIRAPTPGTAAAPGASNPGPLASLGAQAAALIESSQPLKALSLLEPELKKRRDPDVLALAGLAAWRSDDTARALEYWRASLDLHPNPELQTLYARLQHENQSDSGTGKLTGMRVQLRYDASAIPAGTARQMVDVLDQEYGRITAELGCPAEERVIAIAQSREGYRAATETAEWSGGLFDGRIRVPVTDARGVDPELRRRLAHEMVHACLAMLGRWPAWLHEGVAQKLSGDRLSPAMRQKVTELTRSGRLPSLNDLGRDWSHMDTEQARSAYAMSLAAVDLFYENHAGLGLRNLLRSPDRLGEITADLDRLLKQ